MVTEMYTKTHGSIPAGAQKDRHYDWPLNPNSHTFGFGELHNPGGAYRAVNPERQNGIFPKTVIVKKTVEDARAVAGDQLGCVRNLGQGRPPINPNTVFGVPSMPKGNHWNAGQCIQGEPTEA